jgi:hypothetical protein
MEDYIRLDTSGSAIQCMTDKGIGVPEIVINRSVRGIKLSIVINRSVKGIKLSIAINRSVRGIKLSIVINRSYIKTKKTALGPTYL